MTVLAADRVVSARNAVALVFAASGFAFASVISRIPAIRDALELSPGRLGLVLLAISTGSVLALPTAGAVVHRIGAGRAVLTGATSMCVGLVVAALAPEVLGGSIPAIVVGLFFVGVGNGLWDVAMNVEGADVEQRLGRAIMPRFHAAFSLGTVAGAAGGALAAWLGLGVAEHVIPTTVLVYVAVLLAVRRFVPVERQEPQVDVEPAGSGVREAWREPRTLLIGLLVLGMAFAEGSANDWLAVGLVDGYGVSEALAAAGYGAFVTAMTVGRMAGPAILDRFGRVPVLRGGALMVLVGVVVVVLGAELPDRSVEAVVVAAVGSLLWGLGASLGFPVGMSAAADDPAKAAARVSVVASVGYVAFLAGPPLLGLLGEHVGVVRALLGVAGAVALALAAAGAARPLPAQGVEPDTVVKDS